MTKSYDFEVENYDFKLKFQFRIEITIYNSLYTISD